MGVDARFRGCRLCIALFCLVVGVAVSLAKSADAAPALLSIRGVAITNVTDTGFSASWVTDSPLPGSGSVNYGTSPTSLVFQTTELAPMPGARGDIHSVNVRSLSASTTYYFSVVDAGVSDPASGFVYKVTTGPTLQGIPTIHWATGQVFQSDGKTLAVGVLVMVRVLDNANLNGPSPTTSAPLSAFTNAQGYWTIALNPRTSDNSNAFNYATSGSDFLLVTAEGGGLGAVYPAQSASIKLDASGDVAVSPMTLGSGVNPAETPVAVGASPTGTATTTSTPTSLTVPTSTVAGGSPTRTKPSEGTSGSSEAGAPSTPTPVVIPTVAIPTRVLPPVQVPVELLSPSPVRPESRPTDTPAPAPMLVVTPTSGAQAAGGPPGEPIVRVRPSGVLISSPTVAPPTATATSFAPATLTVPADAPSGATEAARSSGPLQSLTLVMSAGLALIGLGLAISVVGFIDQRREG